MTRTGLKEMAWHGRAALSVVLVVLAFWSARPMTLAAQQEAVAPPDPNPFIAPVGDLGAGMSEFRRVLVSLPLATALGAALALRPRRRGTPSRSIPVIETQIILAVIGALVMLVVGASLARAFGIVGAAGLVRYRAKIADPKDAGVMLSTLAIGLASGVGLYAVAVFAAVFIIGVLWLIESFEPKALKAFTLEVTSKDAVKLQPKIEDFLRRRRLKFELHKASPEEISYALELPMEMHTDALSTAIQALDEAEGTAVNWHPEKPPKN